MNAGGSSQDPRLAAIVAQAAAEGLVPAEAQGAEPERRPWPVVLLTALGAWLAAVPLLSVITMLLAGVIAQSVGAYLAGALLLALAVVLLRKPEVPLFIEQLAVPLLLTGASSLAFGLERDVPGRTAAWMLALLSLGLAALLDRPWLRHLLGAGAAGCTMLALVGDLNIAPGASGTIRPWWAVHVTLALGALALWLERQAIEWAARPHWAAGLDATATGWLVATVVALALLAGMSFLVGGVLEPGVVGAGSSPPHRPLPPEAPLTQIGSMLLVFAAALAAVATWTGLRRPAVMGVAVVLVALGAFMPSLGGVVAVLALATLTRRWVLAGTAAVAAAWVIGAFYYQWQWPLAHKALVLVAAGLVLAGLAAWQARHAGAAPRKAPALPRVRSSRAAVGVALTALASLGVVNLGIRQKEDLIANGQAVFVALAPVDPRSLAQGDFMRLNFRLPEEVRRDDRPLVGAERPQVLARRDARGVATLLREREPGEALAADEFAIELTPKNGTWVLVTDAWFFKEGQADRWGRARFGEFRVAADGRALLVGMADERLQRIEP